MIDTGIFVESVLPKRADAYFFAGVSVMSEIKKVSPLLDDVELGERFSERGQTECFYCERIETGEKLVLKHIAIPESDTKVR